MQSPSYWEKTVEYAFILEAAKDGRLDFVAPLAGLEEHATGDAIFGEDDYLFLVEFKVDEKALRSEESLFYDYPDAQYQMRGRDGHHFLVYASKTPVAGQSLPTLAARTYFSAQPMPSAMSCFERGLLPEIFKEYITKLFDLKKPDGRSSGGQISPETLANVVGVSANYKQVSTVTLFEYARRMFPDLGLEHTTERTNRLSSSPNF